MPLKAQTIQILPAPEVRFPSVTDSNSPAIWKGGQLVLFNAMGTPFRSHGADQLKLGDTTQVNFGPGQPTPLWIEAAWVDSDGTVFAWYHHEPPGLCPGTSLTAPKIGAMISHDGGLSFQDLGFVLVSGGPIDCKAQNGYFAGGNGDFAVVLDGGKQFFYFFFSNYGGDLASQGVAVARMPFASRFSPVGALTKYYKGGFTEPGIGGKVTPIYPARVSWASAQADAFWGPSIHWNTAIKKYVMLLNHACCGPYWPQEGVYLSISPDLAVPAHWPTPTKILSGVGWYPQVLGEGANETDRRAGARSRLYVYGDSKWELVVSP